MITGVHIRALFRMGILKKAKRKIFHGTSFQVVDGYYAFDDSENVLFYAKPKCKPNKQNRIGDIDEFTLEKIIRRAIEQYDNWDYSITKNGSIVTCTLPGKIVVREKTKYPIHFTITTRKMKNLWRRENVKTY